jgi:DNA end-binding protein Ku
MAPIKYERVCTADGKEVSWEDIVKGYEYTKGRYVALTNEEIKAARLESSKAIELLDFVKEDEIDSRFFETPYFLVPDKGGEKAYALLREAVRATGMVGIGKFTLRQAQQLVSVRAVGEAMVLEVMRFADELVDPADYTFPSSENIRPQELSMAEQLIGNLAVAFDASRYKDDYRENLKRVIQAKLKGKKIEVEETEAPSTEVVDLMARLQESLAQAKSGEARRGAQSAPARGGRRTRASERPTRSRSRKTA